jgi:glycosyltransferase involved in cell wall biosynthesis
MSKTISNSISTGITLTSAYDPLVITRTGTIETSGAAAIYGNDSQYWQITNSGLVDGLGSYGIDLLAASTITNLGTVTSNGIALRIDNGAGRVTNSGTLGGFQDGIALTDGGTVTNTGTIGGILGAGIEIAGDAGTVTNAGTISGHEYAVQFSGSFADRVIVDPGAVFTGKVQGGTGSNTLELAAGTAGATGTLTGFGSSSFTNFETITIDPGANWQFDATDTISTYVTLTDQGTLANAGVIDTRVTLVGGASLANTGTIQGHYPGAFAGVDITEGVATVTNAGTIAGYAYDVFLGGGGSVGNTGTIKTGNYGDSGVYIRSGILNNSGDIQGYSVGAELDLGGTVINTGYISETGTDLTPYQQAIYIRGGAATVVNAGTIVGLAGTAIKFSGSYADRLIVDPGAVFTGKVRGGSGTNTLEFAVGTAGATGTLSGFGTSFTNFGTIVVDSGAKWELDGAVSGTLENAGLLVATVTMAGGGTVSNTGTIDAGAASYGITLVAGGTVSNTGQGALIEGSRYGLRATGEAATIINGGTILGTSGLNGGGIGLYAGGTIFNTGAINGAGDFGIYITGGAATVSNAGSIGGAAGAVYFKGSTTDRVILDPGAVFQGKVVGGSGSNTLELAAGFAGATGTMSGFGTSFTNFGTIVVDSGAKWELDGAVSGTLENAGLLVATVTMAGGGTVSNTGTIDAGAGSYGITLLAGGTVSNTGKGALIEGSRYGIRAASEAATIVNGGTILGTSGLNGGGIGLYAGGTVTNTGAINGAGDFGIYITGGAATVTNAGSIGGAAGAVYFKGSGTDRVILDPGAVFQGKVVGGSGSNTLELAAGTAGATGTLSGFGTSFTNFSTLTIDPGAKWQFDATDTILYLVTLTDQGTLANAGRIYTEVTLSGLHGGSLANTGTIDGTFVGVALTDGGAVSNTGTIFGDEITGVYIGSGGGTITNAGTIGGEVNAVKFYGSFADLVVLDPGAVFEGKVVGGTGTNTLELAAGTTGATGTLSGIGTSFTNFGTIIVDSDAKWQFDSSGTVASGVSLTDGGVVLVNAGAIDTVVTLTASGTFANTGTVAPGSSANYAVTLQAGGVVTNAGSIIASFPNKGEGVRIDGGAGTLGNSGTIVGGGDGVAMTDGGTVTNSGSIGGTGKVGIYIGGAAGTVTNTGRISGGAYAVEFHGSGTPGGFADRLIIDPGAVFQGKVQGGGADSTIELAAGTAGATGTLSAFGASFTSFGSIVIDSGAKWALDGASPSGQQVTLAGTGDLLALGTPQNFADAIVGFGLSDKLDLTGLAYSTGATATLSDNTLTVTSGSTTDTFTLDGVPAGTKFEAVDDGAPSHGTLVEEVACYCRGTRILTDHGEVPVEDLAVGDVLITASGAARPVKWIGQRSYAGWLAAGNAKVWPICLAPGSLADGVPARALRVSPEHAIWLDGALVPAGLLVNGTSIVKSAPLDEIHYYHVELDTHDIILAEGAAAESFVDDGSRGMFHNAADFHARYPEERQAPATFCAPRLVDGFALDALQQRLAARGRRLRPDGRAAASRLRGYVEQVTRDGVLGWAFDPDAPDTRVAVGVFDNGVEIGRAVADLPRGDLARAGIGDGRHGFYVTVPGGFSTGVRHEIAVRSADGMCLASHADVVLETQAAPETTAPLGRLVGRLDSADRRRVTGWAQDAADPERRVGLVVTANGAPVGRVLANLYRGDLEAAGRGSGRHSFAFALPACLASDETVQIRVLREADGAELPGSPFDLAAVSEAEEAEALKRLLDETQALLARRAARAVGAAREAGGLRALVIDLQTPDPARDGGSAAILSHMRALTSLGFAVGLAPADGRVTPEAEALLSREGIQAYAAPYYAGVEDVLRQHARGFDVIYLHRHECADRYMALARAHHPKSRIVYSVADLHHVRLARQAQVQGRPELLAHSRRVASVEAYAAAHADLVLTHSPAEALVLRQAAGFGRVHVVPFAAATRPGKRGFAERHGLAFIGSFAHAPNADAVYGLAHDIMPLVWAKDPSITCRIAGHGWQPGRLPGLDPRVEILGHTDDLGELLDTVRLTVAPLRFGAGLKAKVLDSFGAALPCVMTRIAAEGLNLTGPLAMQVADDVAEIADRILQLHADEALNGRIGEAAIQLAAATFDQTRVTEDLAEALTLPVGAHRRNHDGKLLDAASQ